MSNDLPVNSSNSVVTEDRHIVLENKVKDYEKYWLALCYLPMFNFVFCLIVATNRVESELARFHARQGLVCFFFYLLTIFLAHFSPVLSLMLWGIVLLVHFSGMYLGYKKEKYLFPILGKFAMWIPEYYLFEKLTSKKPNIGV